MHGDHEIGVTGGCVVDVVVVLEVVAAWRAACAGAAAGPGRRPHPTASSAVAPAARTSFVAAVGLPIIGTTVTRTGPT